jgi:polysaccharide transporter, PST family
MILVKRAFTASLWTAGTAYIFFAVNFAGQILLARLLVPHDFGIYAFALAIKDTLGLFLSFTVSMAFVHSEGAQDDFDAAWILSSALGGVYLVTGLIGGGVIFYLYDASYAYVFGLICAGNVPALMAAVYLAPLEKRLDFKRSSLVRGLSSSLGLFSAVLMAWLGSGVWSLAGREVLSAIILFSLGYLISDLRFHGKLNQTKLKKLFQYCFKMLFSRGMETLYSRFPSVIIGALIGDKFLGNYYQARYLTGLPNMLLASFTQLVSFSLYSIVKNNSKKISEGLCWINYFIVRIMLPATMVVFLSGRELVNFIYGEKWLFAGTLLQGLSGLLFFLPLFSNVKTACYGLGRQMWVSHAYLIASLIAIISVFWGWWLNYQQIIPWGISAGIFAGLVYMFIRLHLEGIDLKIKDVVFKPIALYFLIIVIGFAVVGRGHDVLIWSGCTFCWVLFLAVLERKDMLALYKRIF